MSADRSLTSSSHTPLPFESDPILITAAALITPLGLDKESTWKQVQGGQCGLDQPLTAMEQPLAPGRKGGQCPDLPADELPEDSREVRYLHHAVGQAISEARLATQNPYSPDRCGIILGTTLHGIRAAGRYLRFGNFGRLKDFLAGATLQSSADEKLISGMRATICSACSSSLGSIALGMSLLRSGQFDLIVAGGYDTISEYVYGGFNSLRLVAEGPLKPFSRQRQGMKLAEGYAVVVLERATDASRRNQQALATILGYGESADAHHLTQPHPTGEGAARAMRAAMKSANLSPEEIDLVAAHATATPDNDAAEFAAMKSVFDGRVPPVVAFKSHLGHTLGGAGAVELILSAMSLRDQVIPKCPNITEDEIEFPDLKVATARGPAKIRHTLNTSLGFGGANTCMVLGLPPTQDADVHQKPATIHVSRRTDVLGKLSADVWITGFGIIAPGCVGNEAFVQRLEANTRDSQVCDSGAIPESQYIHLLNARRIRRMSDYVKLSLAATMLACQDANVAQTPDFFQSCSAILGSTHGSTNYSEVYYAQIVNEGIDAANPLMFAEGVPNAAAAHLSLMMSIKGACQTVIGTRTAGLDALGLAASRIASGEWDRVIVSAGEEFSALVNQAYAHWKLHAPCATGQVFDSSGQFAAGCGAATFILESTRSMQQRGGRPRGKIITTWGPRTRPPHRGWLGSRHVLSSANRTWLGRMEAAAIRRGGISQPVVSSLAGQFPELFSVTPLAGIAAVLLTEKLPQFDFDASPPAQLEFARSAQQVDSFTVLASDYTRLLSGMQIELVR